MLEYYKVDEPERPLKLGEVLFFKDKDGEAIILTCPCGLEERYMTSPPFTFTFNENGKLISVGGSTGYHARKDRPTNWCHFTVVDDVIKIHDGDCKCPGKDLKGENIIHVK